MTTTEISESPKLGRIVAIVKVDGGRFGWVGMSVNGRYEASRKQGVYGTDIRRYSQNYRTMEAALAWVQAGAAAL